MYSYLTYRERRTSFFFMTFERNLILKNIKKIHTLYYFPNKHNVECENLQHLKLRRLSITHGIHLSGTKPQTEKEDTVIFQW